MRGAVDKSEEAFAWPTFRTGQADAVLSNWSYKRYRLTYDQWGNFKDILQYLMEEYYRMTRTQGLQKAAYIISDDIIANHFPDFLSENNQTMTKGFISESEAVDWIKQ